MRKSVLEIGAVLISSFNFAGACLAIILWRIHVFSYVPIAFAISLLIGLIVMDIRKSIIYAIASMIIGNVIAAAILLSPYYIFAESIRKVNIAGPMILSSIAKPFLLGASMPLVGAALGSYLAEKTVERTDLEI